MTFPTELERLLREATPAPVTVNPISAHPSFSYAQHSEYQFQARNADVKLYALLRNHADAILGLVRAAEKRAVHYECEDPWYSCPKSAEGCADERQEGCTCGADEIIEALAKLNGGKG